MPLSCDAQNGKPAGSEFDAWVRTKPGRVKNLFALALGFALCWYLFPHVVVVPVVLDPRTGQLIDAQTGEVIAEPKSANDAGAASNKPEPSKSSQPSASDSNKTSPEAKKGDDAKSK
jgi:hypothetical protein